MLLSLFVSDRLWLFFHLAVVGVGAAKALLIPIWIWSWRRSENSRVVRLHSLHYIRDSWAFRLVEIHLFGDRVVGNDFSGHNISDQSSSGWIPSVICHWETFSILELAKCSYYPNTSHVPRWQRESHMTLTGFHLSHSLSTPPRFHFSFEFFTFCQHLFLMDETVVSHEKAWISYFTNSCLWLSLPFWIHQRLVRRKEFNSKCRVCWFFEHGCWKRGLLIYITNSGQGFISHFSSFISPTPTPALLPSSDLFLRVCDLVHFHVQTKENWISFFWSPSFSVWNQMC